MRHFWTFVFVALVALAWALAAWHDREEKKRRERREMAFGENEKKADE